MLCDWLIKVVLENLGTEYVEGVSRVRIVKNGRSKGRKQSKPKADEQSSATFRTGERNSDIYESEPDTPEPSDDDEFQPDIEESETDYEPEGRIVRTQVSEPKGNKL